MPKQHLHHSTLQYFQPMSSSLSHQETSTSSHSSTVCAECQAFLQRSSDVCAETETVQPQMLLELPRWLWQESSLASGSCYMQQRGSQASLVRTYHGNEDTVRIGFATSFWRLLHLPFLSLKSYHFWAGLGICWRRDLFNNSNLYYPISVGSSSEE